MNEKKLNVSSIGNVSVDGIYVPVQIKPASIAASTLIYEENISRFDNIYPNLVATNNLKWEEVAYAHTVLTSQGKYFLILVSNENLFGESRGLFIELIDFPPSRSQFEELFVTILKSRISKGLTACYKNDLDWI